MALTVKDVAQKAGVSTATVSRVMNHDPRITVETSERVRQAIADLGYSPNPFARGLKTSRSLTIGFITPEFTNEFFMGIARGVEKRLQQARYSLIICNASENLEQERARLELLLDRGVDGVIVVPSTSSGAHFEIARSQGVPVVLVDRLVEDYSADAVLVDNTNGTYQALEPLILAGNTRIGFIGGNQDFTSARERYAGYLRLHDDYRIPVDPSLVLFGDFHVESGYRLMGELLSLPDPPHHIFLSNYFMHLGATRWLMEHKLSLSSIPSLVSFDELELSFSLEFCQTFVRQPTTEIGTYAAEFLLGRIEGFEGPSRLVRLRTELVLRNTK